MKISLEGQLCFSSFDDSNHVMETELNPDVVGLPFTVRLLSHVDDDSNREVSENEHQLLQYLRNRRIRVTIELLVDE